MTVSATIPKTRYTSTMQTNAALKIPTADTSTEVITVKVPVVLLHRLVPHTARARCTPEKYIAGAVVEYLAEEEQYDLTAQRLEGLKYLPEDPPVATPTTPVDLHLPAAAIPRLQEYAERNGWNVAEYIVDALAEHLWELELDGATDGARDAMAN